MKNKPIFKICLCAIFIALFVVLDVLSITTPIGKITFSGLPLVIISILYGPLAGLIVGGLGSFVTQLLGYGFDPLIFLWVIPQAARGVFIGLFNMKDKMITLSIVKTFIIVIISGIILSILNTLVMWLHSVVFDYYTFEYVFGSAIYRFIITFVTSCIYAGISILIVPLLEDKR